MARVQARRSERDWKVTSHHHALLFQRSGLAVNQAVKHRRNSIHQHIAACALSQRRHHKVKYRPEWPGKHAVARPQPPRSFHCQATTSVGAATTAAASRHRHRQMHMQSL